MLMNYHEMTMGQPRDDPAKRKQFLVICSVMFSVFAYTLMTSGALLAIEPVNGVFPGGFFCYKFTNRDYAASMGLGRRIQNDLAAEFGGGDTPERKEAEEMLYHVYLDDPMRMGGRRQRWMSGIMVGKKGKPKIQKLKALNKNIKKLTEDELRSVPAREVFASLEYEQGDLPSVDALVLQFPFTDGFVSALMLSYRIIPAIRKLAIEKGEQGIVPVVISNCSKEQQMCTHYAPLVKSKKFLLGRPDTEAHLEALEPEKFVDWKGVKEGLRAVFPFLKEYIDKLP